MPTAELSARAMLVRLSITQWTARKKDKNATKTVQDTYHNSPETGSYNKALIAKDSLAKITAACSEARTFHYANTLPWEDAGARILPARNYLAYTQAMRKLEGEFRAAVSDFTASFPAFVESAKATLNGLFDPADYPDAGKVSEKFSWSVSVSPLPTRDDFRVDLDAVEVEAIRKDLDTRAQDAMKSATKDLWTRLHDAVSHMAEKLSTADAIFRDTLVQNVRDLCDLLPALNVADDPQLEAMRQTIKAQLAARAPEELRNNPMERQQAAQQAADILDHMKGYMQ